MLILPAVAMAAAMVGGVHALVVVELTVAGALVAWAPRLAVKVVPHAVLALAVEGLVLAKDYHNGFSNQVLYGLVRRDRPAPVYHRESGQQARGGHLCQAGPGAV